MILRKLRDTLFTLFLICISTAIFAADQITLKDGQVLKGSIVGRADGVVTFEIGGQQLKIQESNIASMQIILDDTTAGATEAAPAAPAPAAATPAQAQTPANPTLPAGTRMSARLSETLDSGKHKAGHRFTARLEANLVADGVVIAERGTTVYGTVAAASSSGRVAGSSSLSLAFTDILINNQMYPIATQPLAGKTDNTAKKSTRSVVRGAVVGGLIDGSKGARTGAKVGAGAAILTGGNKIYVPSGTLLETQLRVPFTLN